MIQVGDHVIPSGYDPEYDSIWTPCRVTRISKRGRLHAQGLDIDWWGHVSAFKVVNEQTVG